MRPLRDLWFENALLLAVLVLLAVLYVGRAGAPALAAGGGWETNGVIALSSGGEKLILVDTNKKNICIYKVRGVGEFRLVGARNYQYDVEIEDTAAPDGSAGVTERGPGWTYVEVRRFYEQGKKAR
jgi:hypothetical protein